MAGDHPTANPQDFLVGPSTDDQFNTAHLRLIPIACWRVDDIRFAFDSSFVTADSTTAATDTPNDIRAELTHLTKLVKEQPGCPISVFGHADPVGSDDYNKALSGRRATAIYALLIFNTSPDEAVQHWQKLAATESWGTAQRDIMQATTGLTSDTPTSTVIRAYMKQLASAGPSLGKHDFLAQGADAGGKGDYQGCSEFNPLLLFSQEKQAQFDQAKQNNDTAGIADRNLQNAPNRRVLVLMFRKGSRVDPAKWPCPRATEGTAGCIKRFWSDGQTRRSTHLSGADRQFELTQDTFGCRFYQRISTDSPCEKVIPFTPPSLDVIIDHDDNFTVDAAEPVTPFVRVGIWDNAFDPATGTLINTAAEAKNFIGHDSKGPLARRFYFRVRDQHAAGTAEIRLNWRTEFGAGGADDAPGSQVISLLPTAAEPSVFLSHSVFLVTDDIDQAQATDSGLAAPLTDTGSRAAGDSNHRVRKITVNETHQLDSTIVAEYTSPVGGAVIKATVPVFQRSPEERLRIRVHLVNVRATAGGTPVVNAARKQTGIDTLRSVYARCGIYLDIDEIVIDPPASCINWQTRYPASLNAASVDPAVESAGFPGSNLVPSKSQVDIINVIRAGGDFDAQDIYIVYVNRIFGNPIPAPSATAILPDGPGGISFPDSFSAAGSIGRSFVFVALLDGVSVLADPHEMTHVTTNLRNSAGGHFHLQANVATGPGNIDGRNLMQRFVLISNGDTADSKRLWDTNFTNAGLSPSTIPAQIKAIRASRFIRPF